MVFQVCALEIIQLKLAREYRDVLSLLLEDGFSFKFFHSHLVNTFTELGFNYIYFISWTIKMCLSWSMAREMWQENCVGLRRKVFESSYIFILI